MHRASCARKNHKLAFHLKQIHTALDRFKEKCGRYPLTEEGIVALAKVPEGLRCPGYPQDGFITQDKLNRDPWGSSYVYVSRGQAFFLRSLGSDGHPGGTGTERDVAYPDLAVPVAAGVNDSGN